LDERIEDVAYWMEKDECDEWEMVIVKREMESKRLEIHDLRDKMQHWMDEKLEVVKLEMEKIWLDDLLA